MRSGELPPPRERAMRHHVGRMVQGSGRVVNGRASVRRADIDMQRGRHAKRPKKASRHQTEARSKHISLFPGIEIRHAPIRIKMQEVKNCLCALITSYRQLREKANSPNADRRISVRDT